MLQIQPTTITQKGQVTIPSPVRKVLGLRRGDQIEFTITKNKSVLLKPVKKSSILSLYGSLKPKFKPKLSGQELVRWEKEMAHLAWAQKAN